MGTTEETDLSPYLAQLAEAKRVKNEAEATIKSLTTLLVEEMGERDIRKVRAEGPDDTIITGTLVTPSVVEVDEGKLKRKVGAKLWNSKLTKRILDRQKLDDALANGEVDIADVAMCSTEVPRTPYVKITSRADRRAAVKR